MSTPEKEIQLRERCACGSEVGIIRPKSNQNVVYCICGLYKFCARREEIDPALEPRSVRTTKFKPKQRARILIRDNGQCVLCGSNQGLHLGHLISVKDGPSLGLSEEDLYSDENVMTMCEECNLGIGAQSVTARLIAALIRRGTM